MGAGLDQRAAAAAADMAAAAVAQVTAVVVAYDSAAVLPACLASLPPGLRRLVVDNASTDGSAEAAAAAGAEVIRLDRNLGFGRAANLGLGAATTRYGLLLNADARCALGMVEALVAAAGRYPEAGLLSPMIRTPEGQLQFGRAGLFGRRHRTPPVPPEGDCCAPYAGGAAFLFPLEAFRAVGGFDPALFLYYEDDDLCLRLRRAGHSLIYVRAAALEHLSGRSSASSPRLQRAKEWHMAWSRCHVEAKHRGRPAAVVRALAEVAALSARLVLRPGDPRRAKWSARRAGTLGWLAGRQATAVGIR